MGLTRMREVCFLIGSDDSILWADTSDSPIALRDSRRRWERIWFRRDEIVEIAHSHPGGPAGFSTEDLTTIAAIDAALGRSLRYSVVTPGEIIRTGGANDALEGDEPWWASFLRAASGILP